MQFMSGSLSVSCNYCHAGQFESDAKKTKLIARDMIKMTRAITDSWILKAKPGLVSACEVREIRGSAKGNGHREDRR
jgi:hypothetical protein